jgi:hypothetical protein
MYFKKTATSMEIFDLAKFVYYNWQSIFENTLKPESRPTYVSTDVVFAIVLKLLDIDQEFYSTQQLPTFVHMKSQLQGWGADLLDEDWNKLMSVFFNPSLECKIGNYLQFFPLHYHVKNFLTDEIIGYYERATP